MLWFVNQILNFPEFSSVAMDKIDILASLPPATLRGSVCLPRKEHMTNSVTDVNFRYRTDNVNGNQ